MSWNASYVFLILFTTIVSYVSAILIAKSNSKKRKKAYLVITLMASLGTLFFFKYFNFLIDSIYSLLNIVYVNQVAVPALDVLLPVGISFYTFQTLSYTIDIYRNEIAPEKHFGIYALYVSFFPQLVAGPIERSSNLLPQFRTFYKVNIDNIIIGLKFIIMGFFMKLVVADRLSIYVNAIYNNLHEHNGMTLALATFFFSFQILCDFAGYSNIAIGVAKWFGYDLMLNFRRPYFATSISDFWRRWHISLSTWFRDYLYIPLGGSRVTIKREYFNLFITFLISGLWHGANWTFLIWGALHGLYLTIEKYFKINKITSKGVIRIFRTFFVFTLVSFAWIFFRANSISDSSYIVSSIIQMHGPLFTDWTAFFYGGIGIVILLILDLISELKKNDILYNNEFDWKVSLIFSSIIFLIFTMGVFNGGQFIYFQF